ECIDEARPIHGVAADPDTRALPDTQVRELPDPLVRKRSRPADHTDPARLVDIPWHDPDLAGARRDDSRAIRSDQPRTRVMGLQIGDGAYHINHRNALSDRNDDLDARFSRFHDCVGRKWRWHEDHGRIGPRRRHGFAAGVEYRHAERRRATTAWRDSAHEIRAIRLALLGMKRPRFAGDALTDQLGILVDQNAHRSSRIALANLRYSLL